MERVHKKLVALLLAVPVAFTASGMRVPANEGGSESAGVSEESIADDDPASVSETESEDAVSGAESDKFAGRGEIAAETAKTDDSSADQTDKEEDEAKTEVWIGDVPADLLPEREGEGFPDMQDDPEAGIMPLSFADAETYTYVISYVYEESGARAAATYVSTVTEDYDAFSVVSPAIVNFTPDQEEVTISPGQEPFVITVRYTSSATADYTVEHWGETMDPDADGAEQMDGLWYVKLDETNHPGVLLGSVTEAAESAKVTDLPGYARGSGHTKEENAGTIIQMVLSDPADSPYTVKIFYELEEESVIFNANGGVILSGENVFIKKHGETVNAPDADDVVRAGYTLLGWTKTLQEDLAEGESVPEDMIRPDEAIMMDGSAYRFFAVWQKAESQYTLHYYTQTTDGISFDYVGASVITERADHTPIMSGDVITVGDISKEQCDADMKEFFSSLYEDANGFSFDHTSIDGDSVTVAGDKSTIIDVFYARNEYTLYFVVARLTNGGMYQVATRTTGGLTGSKAGGTRWSSEGENFPHTIDSANSNAETPDSHTFEVMEIGGVSYLVKSVTALYEAEIWREWPALTCAWNGCTYISWGTDPDSNYAHTYGNPNIKGTYETMSHDLLIEDENGFAQSSILLAYWTGRTPYNYTYIYMIQDAEGGDNYSEDYRETVLSTDEPHGQSPTDIPGFTLDPEHTEYPLYDGGEITFYFTRNAYTLDLLVDSDSQLIDEETDILWGSDISEYLNWFDTHEWPDGYDSAHFTFAGWYISPSESHGGFEFTGKEMPMQNLALYAYFKPKTYSVTFQDKNGNALKTQDVALYGNAKEDADVAALEGTVTENGNTYQFVHWYYRDEGGNERIYSFGMQITADITVYPKYVQTAGSVEVTVNYYETGTNTPVAASKSETAGYAEAKTFMAENIRGYVPTKPSQTIVPTSDTEISFYYDPVGMNTYTVAFMDKNGMQIASLSKSTYQTVVTESYVDDSLAALGDLSKYFNLSDADTAKQTVAVEPDGSTVVSFVLSRKSLVIEAASGNWVYDGQEHGGGFTVSYDKETVAPNADGTYTLPTGDTLTLTLSDSSIKNVGEIRYAITIDSITDKNGTSKTDYYNINESTMAGVLTVTPREVTLTSAADSKVYDGEPLTNAEITVGGMGFVKGEGVSYTVLGSQTNVGSSLNFFTYTLNAGTEAGNYAITVSYGILSVDDIQDPVGEGSDDPHPEEGRPGPASPGGNGGTGGSDGMEAAVVGGGGGSEIIGNKGENSGAGSVGESEEADKTNESRQVCSAKTADTKVLVVCLLLVAASGAFIAAAGARRRTAGK